jgi:glutamate 5-kinase
MRIRKSEQRFFGVRRGKYAGAGPPDQLAARRRGWGQLQSARASSTPAHPRTASSPVTNARHLDKFTRVVVKVGSSLLVDRTRGALKQEWLDALVADIADLHKRGAAVLVVSSGPIALGRTIAGLPKGALKLEDSQAAAAIGQIALARAWSQALHAHGILAGQVLLTLNDTEERRRYLNARETLGRLSAMRAIPIINENDTVATSEIRYGDNDRLAARVATMASADLLILLSDIAGLYTAPPKDDPKAKLIPVVERVTPAIEAMAGGAASELSRGGMRTKIEAARIATTAGSHMIIADGRVAHPIARIDAGGPCTWFLSPSNPVAARKIWIGGTLELKGSITVDAGAVRALASGKSLLPAGVTRVEGAFARGDCVAIRDEQGAEIGRGLIAYDALHAERIRGRNSRDIAHILGTPGRAEMIHRDDMALAGR